MDHTVFGIVFVTFISVLFIKGDVLRVQKRDWIDNPPATIREGDVECFSEYMEVWIHRMKIEGLKLWLSGALRVKVSFTSLDHLNLQLSACGFSLHNDPDKNYIFRVMYSGCFVQQQHGSNVLALNLVKRINRFGGRTHRFIMKCPMVSAPPNREHIQCDPDYIQVTREIPNDSWSAELQWSLALRGNLIVALEDASLIQLNIDKAGNNITVQGRRTEILSPVTVLEKTGEFLALKLVSGQYAYSMEATCPNVPAPKSLTEETVLHIFKRRMGLTKRGGYDSETLTVSSVSVDQTDVFTVHESRDFVQLIVPTARILQTKTCITDERLLQPFYRVDVLLAFKETSHMMHWIMENSLPCTGASSLQSFLGTNGHITTTPKPVSPYTTSTPHAYGTAPRSTSMTSTRLRLATVKRPVEDPASTPPTSTKSTPNEETSADASTTHSPHTETNSSDYNVYTRNATSLEPSENVTPQMRFYGTVASETVEVHDATAIDGGTRVESLGPTSTQQVESQVTINGTGQVDFHGTRATNETASAITEAMQVALKTKTDQP